MKIQYCSDLHLEFAENNEFLGRQAIEPVGDILILAGDITYLRNDFYQNSFFDYVSQNWKTVYWLPGNHEFYCGIDMQSYDFSKPIEIRKNVLLVNNITIEIENIALIFSTLWSKIDKSREKLIVNNVSDFYCIINNEKRLDAETFNNLHKQSLKFITEECKKHTDKTKIIVTHHLPADACNAPEFRGSKINSAFCTDLTDFVIKTKADYWVYAHSHRNMPDFEIGKTKMLTNQLGYVKYNEHKFFKKNVTINLK